MILGLQVSVDTMCMVIRDGIPKGYTSTQGPKKEI